MQTAHPPETRAASSTHGTSSRTRMTHWDDHPFASGGGRAGGWNHRTCRRSDRHRAHRRPLAHRVRPAAAGRSAEGDRRGHQLSRVQDLDQGGRTALDHRGRSWRQPDLASAQRVLPRRRGRHHPGGLRIRPQRHRPPGRRLSTEGPQRLADDLLDCGGHDWVADKWSGQTWATLRSGQFFDGWSNFLSTDSRLRCAGADFARGGTAWWWTGPSSQGLSPRGR